MEEKDLITKEVLIKFTIQRGVEFAHNMDNIYKNFLENGFEVTRRFDTYSLLERNEDNEYRAYINPNTKAWNFKKGYIEFQLASNYLVILIQNKDNLNSSDFETIEYVINTIIKIQYTYIRCVTVENLFIHFIHNIDEITKMYKFYKNDEAEINRKTSLMKTNSEGYNYSYSQTRKMCIDLEYDYIENLHLDNGKFYLDNVWRTAIAMGVDRYMTSNVELIELKKYIEHMLDIIKHRYLNYISDEYTEKILKHS